MAYFPMFIDLSGRRCLLVGGGSVAGRKIDTLLAYGASVRVISREVSSRIAALASGQGPDGQPPGCGQGKQAGDSREQAALSIRLCEPDADILLEEIRGSALVVAASGDRRINHETAQICRRLGIPVNVVDAPAESTFLFPAVVKRGDISIGINTGGDSPLVSKRIRQEIEKYIPDYYAEIARQLGQIRTGIKERIPDESLRRRFLSGLSGAAFSLERPLTEEEIGEIEKRLGIADALRNQP